MATVKMFTTKDCKKWNILFKTSNLAISMHGEWPKYWDFLFNIIEKKKKKKTGKCENYLTIGYDTK